MTLRRCWFGIAFLGMLLALLPVQAHAQTGTATITGLVLDETGAAMPGVTVTATNQATNVTHVAVSNQAGNYTITPVVVGTYVIKAELTGFRTATTAPVVLEARQVARLDFKMGVGLAETVEVSGATPILQTETTSVGELISGNTVQSLPLNGRNTGQLTLLLPGTITYNPRGFTNIGSVNMNRPFVNGNREQTNNFTVDGLDVNETIDNRVAYQPVPDALAEISVETNNYGADVGNVGGAIDQQRHQVRRQSVPRECLRVLPEQRLRREHLGKQPFERRQAGTHTAHLRWHTRRPDHHQQTVLLRRLSGVAAGRTRLHDGVGGAGRVAARRFLVRHHGDPRSAERSAVHRQSDPDRAVQPDGPRDTQRSGELPAAEPHSAGRDQWEFRRPDAARDPRAPG